MVTFPRVEPRSALHGVAFERVLVAACLVWIAAAAVWWSLSDEAPDEAPDEPPAVAGAPEAPARAPQVDDVEQVREPASGPTLEGTGAADRAGAEPGPRLRELAGRWMSGGGFGPDDQWLQPWLAEDPRRVLALIDALLGVEHPQPLPGPEHRLLRVPTLISRMRLDFTAVLVAALADARAGDLERAAYVLALGGMGRQAAQALPLLHRMAQEGPPFDLARLHLPEALLHVEGPSRQVTALVRAILRDDGRLPDRDYDRRLLDSVVAVLGPRATDVAEALTEYVAREDVDTYVRYRALRLLGKLPLDMETRRRAAVVALGLFPTSRRDTVLPLLQGLSQEDLLALVPHLEGAAAQARVNGVAALIQAGIDGRPLAHLVVPSLQDPSAPTRAQAVRLLPMVVQDVDEVLPIARAMLAGRDPALWLTATRALGALTSAPGDRRAVVRELVTCVESPDAAVRKLAVQSLLMFDDQSAAIVSMLGELLRDDDAKIRAEAVDALGELSAHEPTARAALERALSDRDEHVRSVAAYWLKDEDAEDD